MRSFFRSLEAEGVEYLLISGQAAVIYGASMFSEDFDLWVRPTNLGLVCLSKALARVGARSYKLTPPLELPYARRGHGFHFTVPAPGGAEEYVDVMLVPPRVGGFAAARRRARVVTTDWGRVPVVAIEDLVRLKQTRRLGDYEVISNLVSLHLRSQAKPTRARLEWAVANTFRLDDVRDWVERYPGAGGLVAASSRPAMRTLAKGDESRAARALLREIGELQAADIAYWGPVIDELRSLRRDGRLLEVGARVERLPGPRRVARPRPR